jgi:type IV pilus assembly protein PilB
MAIDITVGIIEKSHTTAPRIEVMPDMRQTAEDNAIVNLVDRILAKAIEDRAGYLYFEPQAKSLQMRIRKDGILQVALQNLPTKMVAPTIAYLKTLAQIELDLPAPQTGRIERESRLGRIGIDVTTLPTQFGDRVTAKLAYIDRPPLSLDRLVSNREILDSIQQLIHCERGLILVVGGRDSGKDTTIDASLAELCHPERLTYAIDRECKHSLPGIERIMLPDTADEKTISHTIAACLGEQPDVLSLGRIDNIATARAALQAVAGGCLVLASIEAETAGGAIAKLIELGISPARLYTATIGIITQKTIDRVCERCRLPHEPESGELAQLGSTMLMLNERRTYFRANRLGLSDIERAKQIGNLCTKCQGCGYSGRIALHEVATITDRLKSALVAGDAERIDVEIHETGLRSFMDLAIPLFREGQISIAEVRRCIPARILLQNQLTPERIHVDSGDLGSENYDTLEAALYWKQQATNAKADYESLLTQLEDYQQESDRFQQRIEQSRSQTERGTRAEIALQLLSVIDVIELARSSIKPQTDREAAIQKGYSMLENKMLSSIREIGVRVTETKGCKFDSHLHEIVKEIGTHEHPAGIIIEEFKRGYTLGDRVLRLAQVKVAVASSYV